MYLIRWWNMVYMLLIRWVEICGSFVVEGKYFYKLVLFLCIWLGKKLESLKYYLKCEMFYKIIFLYIIILYILLLVYYIFFYFMIIGFLKNIFKEYL